MQSNMGYINLLPALPEEWSTGSVDGIVARGNFELKMDWNSRRLTSVSVLSNNGGECVMQYSGIEDAEVRDSKGTAVATTKTAGNRISFETTKGETYTVFINYPSSTTNNTAAMPSAKGTVIKRGNIQYAVTKSAVKNGTVMVKKLTSAGKKKSAITIPATIKDNRGYTFKVTAVAKNAFQKSKKLQSVVIGKNITSIGAKSISKCSKLKKITWKSTAAPKIGSQAFKGIKAKCKIYYPKKMKAKALKTLKSRIKSAGAGKKVIYKKK